MKRFLVVLLLVFTFTENVFSQELTFCVECFYLDESSLSASSESIIIDPNGNKCSLIKIETRYELTIKVGEFDSITKRENKENSIWIYLPSETRKIESISHKDLGTIKNFMLPLKLEPGKSYIMKLNESPRDNTIKKLDIMDPGSLI